MRRLPGVVLAFSLRANASLRPFLLRQIGHGRVQLAIAGLSGDEVLALKYIADLPAGMVWGHANKGVVDFHAMASIPRLLDKQLIIVLGEFEEGHPAYHLTPLGRIVAQLVKSGLRKFKADVKENEEQKQQDG